MNVLSFMSPSRRKFFHHSVSAWAMMMNGDEQEKYKLVEGTSTVPSENSSAEQIYGTRRLYRRNKPALRPVPAGFLNRVTWWRYHSLEDHPSKHQKCTTSVISHARIVHSALKLSVWSSDVASSNNRNRQPNPLHLLHGAVNAEHSVSPWTRIGLI